MAPGQPLVPPIDVLHLDADRARLEQMLIRHPRWARLGTQLLNVLTARPDPAVSVILEDQYVDRDYAEAYGRFYGRAFHAYPRLCQRLHFFSTRLERADFIAADTSDQDAAFGERLKARYLGFCVLRPTLPMTIGRTVIKSPLAATDRAALSCRRRHEVNLLGYQLDVTGVPFIEQDGRSAACASSAIWMATAVMSQRLGLSLQSMAAITDLAREPRPERGLNVDQIVTVLGAMGYTPAVHDEMQFQLMKRYCYAYIASGIPVILAVTLPTTTHALVVCGYRYRPSPHTALRTLHVDAGWHGADWLSHFIVHDDQRGPYCDLSLIPFQRLSQKPKTTAHQLLSELGLPVDTYHDAPIVQWAGETGVLTQLIAPLPPRTFILADGAEDKARSILEVAYGKLGQSFDANICMRTYLIESNRFKQAVFDRALNRPELAKRYRIKNMPRFIWVTEVFRRLPRSSQDTIRFPIEAELLIDSTSSDLMQDFVAGYLDGHYVAMDMTQDDHAAALADPQLVAGTGEYFGMDWR